MRVILDTNLLVSALITPNGPTDQLYRAWRDRRFVRYPKLRPFIDDAAAAGTMYNQLRYLAVVLTELDALDMLTDPDDNNLLAMARASAADYLATGDKRDVLKVKTFERNRIVTAKRLLYVPRIIRNLMIQQCPHGR